MSIWTPPGEKEAWRTEWRGVVFWICCLTLLVVPPILVEVFK